MENLWVETWQGNAILSWKNETTSSVHLPLHSHRSQKQQDRGMEKGKWREERWQDESEKSRWQIDDAIPTLTPTYSCHVLGFALEKKDRTSRPTLLLPPFLPSLLTQSHLSLIMYLPSSHSPGHCLVEVEVMTGAGMTPPLSNICHSSHPTVDNCVRPHTFSPFYDVKYLMDRSAQTTFVVKECVK